MEYEQALRIIQCLQGIEGTLGRIADALDKVAGVKANPDRQIDRGYACSTAESKEGYSTRVDWNDYTKNGLSSADSREGDNLPPYKPVDFSGILSTRTDPSNFNATASKFAKKVFGNACEDEECQK